MDGGHIGSCVPSLKVRGREVKTQLITSLTSILCKPVHSLIHSRNIYWVLTTQLALF